ncbi:Npt1/Npt2 family nucleotide transporter [Kordia jejudonensis]|uniref:Npt1/Npt2 family nucleotide transporter n=1 Tax=Kordia jejudonensis TaxID=1348245 RepID=UPI000628FEC2|nr:Npt1/Npt2 family nucleotide transporter [Kordia jejudonensis]
MLKGFLNKTFGLRDGEIYISFLMQLYIFLIITVLLIVKPTVNAIFLSQLGAEHLPYGYLLVALIAVITSYFYNKAIRRFSLIKVTVTSILFFSLGFIILSALLHFSLINDWILYVYYLGVSLFAVVATSQFWILANMVYNSREAKRLFGFIGAGAIAGGVFGGYLTSLVVSAFGNKTVVLLAAALLLCCIPIIQKVWKIRLKVMNMYVRNQRKFNETNTEEASIKIISKSKHLTYLALITGISVVVAKLVDFQFSDFANKAINNPEELAAFFGFWFSTFNVLALILQLFFTNRVLSKLGVSSTLLILPLGIALGCLLFLTFPELWVLVIIKGIDGSFKQSVNKAAFELSIMPIPLNIKNQAKSYIDVVVDSIATGLSGFMLIFLIRKLDLDTSYITIIVLFFVFIWILLIYKLREAYYNSFRKNIESTILKNDDSLDEGRKPETTITAARRILSGDDEVAILNLLDRLSNYKVKSLKSSIVKLLTHPSNKVKTEAIQQLYTYDDAIELEKVTKLIYEKDDDLVLAALDYVLHHSVSETEFFETYLNNENEYIANAALFCLAKEASSNKELASKFELNNRITEKINSINGAEVDTRAAAVADLLIAIAYAELPEHYYFIEKYLKSHNNTIKSHAIKAAGIIKGERFIDALFECLSEKEYRKKAIKALKSYGPGITTTILNLDKREALKAKNKRFVPRIIEAFKTQNAVNMLLSLMKSRDFIIRLEASRSLLKLNQKRERLVFSTRLIKSLILKETKHYKEALEAQYFLNQLIELDTEETIETVNVPELTLARQNIVEVLEEQLDISLKTIFKLLAIIYEENDIKIAYSGLLSDVNEARINALEFLDNLLKGQLKFKLIPLLEHYVNENDSLQHMLSRTKIVDEKMCLTLLVKNRGKRIKLEVLELIRISNDNQYRAIVKALKKHKSVEVKYAATQTLKHLQNLALK